MSLNPVHEPGMAETNHANRSTKEGCGVLIPFMNRVWRKQHPTLLRLHALRGLNPVHEPGMAETLNRELLKDVSVS